MATFKSTENQRDRRENWTGPLIGQLLHFTIRETDGQRKKVTCPDLHRKLPTELLPGPESAFICLFNDYHAQSTQNRGWQSQALLRPRALCGKADPK